MTAAEKTARLTAIETAHNNAEPFRVIAYGGILDQRFRTALEALREVTKHTDAKLWEWNGRMWIRSYRGNASLTSIHQRVVAHCHRRFA